MYLIRTHGYDGNNLAMQWALPDRVLFACGACHILAYAFLERHGGPGVKAVWLRPEPPFRGNHIVAVSDEGWLFDYHGYSRTDAYLTRHFARARRRWPGWDAKAVDLPPEVLISEAKSKTYDGLWLRQPDQFLRDALPRARGFVERVGVGNR